MDIKLGIEEEYYVLDKETRFFTSDAAGVRLMSSIRTPTLFRKTITEIPFRFCDFFKSGLKLKDILTFPIIELREGPSSDIDELMEHLKTDRKAIAETAESYGKIIVPTGLHPLYSTRFSGALSSGLHTHVSFKGNMTQAFDKILPLIPALISISANSPFAQGKEKSPCSRLLYGTTLGIPRDMRDKCSDFSYNVWYDTLEIRATDVQITTGDTKNLLVLIKAIAENLDRAENSGMDYAKERERAIMAGKKYFLDNRNTPFFDRVFDTMKEGGYEKNLKSILSEDSPAGWQQMVRERAGFTSLIDSLWDSFRRDKYSIELSGKDDDIEERVVSNRALLLSSLPILLGDICGKTLRERVLKKLK